MCLMSVGIVAAEAHVPMRILMPMMLIVGVDRGHLLRHRGPDKNSNRNRDHEHRSNQNHHRPGPRWMFGHDRMRRRIDRMFASVRCRR